MYDLVSNFSPLKQIQVPLVLLLVGVSAILTIYDWTHMKTLSAHLHDASWIGAGLLLTEAFFVLGALLMAVSAGESFADYKSLHHWPRHVRQLRHNAKMFAQRLLTSRLFAVGFWLNFVGAIGTSLILIIAILLFAPVAGLGILVVIAVDLIATFGWRVPLEINRRKARKHELHQSTTRNQS